MSPFDGSVPRGDRRLVTSDVPFPVTAPNLKKRKPKSKRKPAFDQHRDLKVAEMALMTAYYNFAERAERLGASKATREAGRELLEFAAARVGRDWDRASLFKIAKEARALNDKLRGYSVIEGGGGLDESTGEPIDTVIKIPKTAERKKRTVVFWANVLLSGGWPRSLGEQQRDLSIVHHHLGKEDSKFAEMKTRQLEEVLEQFLLKKKQGKKTGRGNVTAPQRLAAELAIACRALGYSERDREKAIKDFGRVELKKK